MAVAVILGTNEIASAVAVNLRRAGYGVVLSHDPHPAVIRRKMAFHDALYDDAVSLDGIAADRADTGFEIRSRLGASDKIIVTELGLLDLIVVQALDLLVDARMQKYRAKPDLRDLTPLTIGLGPGFCGGTNCDIAIETRPGKAGRIIQEGPTDAPDAIPRPLGNRGEERFVRAEFPGRWHTAVEIGTRVYKDFVIGHLHNSPIRAPFDGLLRGVVRDGTEVDAGAKIIEVDPRGRTANFEGIDHRGRVIAKAVMLAIAFRKQALSEKARVVHSQECFPPAKLDESKSTSDLT
jgi:xanthine dehydrogenase accessory factor